MSLKQKLISTVTLAFAIVAFTTFASAQNAATRTQDSVKKQQKSERGDFGRRGGRGFGKEKHGRSGDKMMRGFSRLNLTDAQKSQIKSLMEANRAANQGTQQELRDLAVKKRSGSITADEQARFETLKEQKKASAEQTHNTILALLTAEQHAQLDQMKAERKQKMEERKQKMQERRQNRQSAPKQTQDN